MNIWDDFPTRSTSLPISITAMKYFPIYAFMIIFGMLMLVTPCASYTWALSVIKTYPYVVVGDATTYFYV